ncbi:MAG: hypothetical protein ACREPP_07810 [Rhodanobacteraceae bacterium]
MRILRNSNPQPDALTLAAATWLAAGVVLLLLTPLPAHDARTGWSIAFWLLAAPAAVLAIRLALHADHALSPVRLRSMRRRNSCMTRR